MKYAKALFYAVIVITLIVQQIQICFLMDRIEYIHQYFEQQIVRHIYDRDKNYNELWNSIRERDEKLWGIIRANNLVEKEEETKDPFGDPIEDDEEVGN